MSRNGEWPDPSDAVRKFAEALAEIESGRQYVPCAGPAGLTVNQFGLLGYLHGASFAPAQASSIGTIAEWLGMDPTTLNRNLKPLLAKGMVRNATDPTDGRVRIVRITDKGLRTLRKALPHWRGAQADVEKVIGARSIAELNALLDLSASRLRASD